MAPIVLEFSKCGFSCSQRNLESCFTSQGLNPRPTGNLVSLTLGSILVDKGGINCGLSGHIPFGITPHSTTSHPHSTLCSHCLIQLRLLFHTGLLALPAFVATPCAGLGLQLPSLLLPPPSASSSSHWAPESYTRFHQLPSPCWALVFHARLPALALPTSTLQQVPVFLGFT